MRDPRLSKLAQVLVNYSTTVAPDDLVRLSGPPVARPLVVALYRAVLEAGAHPHVEMVPDECEEVKLELAQEEQLLYQDPLDLFAVGSPARIPRGRPCLGSRGSGGWPGSWIVPPRASCDG